jgi:hypothetical protein
VSSLRGLRRCWSCPRPPVQNRESRAKVLDLGNGLGHLLSSFGLAVECLLEPLLEARAAFASAALAVR